MPSSNIVISGVGVVSSIGIGAENYFSALVQKRSGIQSLAARTDEGAKPGPDSMPAGLWIGGPIVDFDPKQFVRPRKALKVMCREIQTAFAASQLAIEEAGLSDTLPAEVGGQLQPDQVGTVFGSEMFYGPASEMEDAIVACMRDDGSFNEAAFGTVAMKKVLPLWMLKYLPNMPACHVGIALGAHGPNNTLVLGDVSGPAAMMEAVSCLGRGIAKIMISGASGTRINTTRLNYRNDLPIADVFDPISESSRPHDPNSRGIVGGEAAASLVLETESHARGRGIQPVARILAYASRFAPSGAMGLAKRTAANDSPSPRGSSKAIRLAIEETIRSSNVKPAELGLIVSHASGDPVIDQAEREAIQSILPGIPVSAPMASLGHTGAASGEIELATGALAIAHQTIPPAPGDLPEHASVALQSSPTELKAKHVICLAHTSEGNATAVLLG